MLAYQFAPDQFRLWTGESVQPVGDADPDHGVQFPSVIEQTFTDQQLAEYNLFHIVPFVEPDGQHSVGGATYSRIPGEQKVQETYAVEVDPPPPLHEQRAKDFALDPNIADLLDKLKNATPAQIDTWLTANVTNLAQARTVLGYVIKVLVVLTKRELRQ
jgi:hypothetical protein